MNTMRNVAASILIIVGCIGTSVHASVIDSADITFGATTYGTFVDESTGLTWLDLDNFWGPTDTTNTVIADLVGSGFHLATTSELTALTASIGVVGAGSAWTAMATIVGGNYFGNADHGVDRELIWGIYDDQNGGDTGYSWQYSSGGWNIVANVIDPNRVLETVNNSSKDLGAWVVSDNVIAAVPEPSTLALLALGLAGIGFRRRQIH